MGQTIRVSLPGNDALTDTNPDHYALYADQDWVLIKELTRGSITAPNSVTHNLGYVPVVFAFWQNGTEWVSTAFDVIDDYPTFWVTTTQVFFFESATYPSTKFKYFICYDDQV